MIRTLIAGAIAAFVGDRLFRMNRAGTLDPVKQRLREGAADLRHRLADRRAEAAAAAPAARKPAKPRKAPSPVRAKAVRAARAARAVH